MIWIICYYSVSKMATILTVLYFYLFQFIFLKYFVVFYIYLHATFLFSFWKISHASIKYIIFRKYFLIYFLLAILLKIKFILIEMIGKWRNICVLFIQANNFFRSNPNWIGSQLNFWTLAYLALLFINCINENHAPALLRICSYLITAVHSAIVSIWWFFIISFCVTTFLVSVLFI